MSETARPTRGVCLRQTKNNFYLAVDRPFHPQLQVYKRFRGMAARCVVRLLEEGSQVFVYPREEFTSDDPFSKFSDSRYAFTDADMFLEKVIVTAQEMGGDLVIDPSVEYVVTKADQLGQPDHSART